jgi:hypothetical protein
MPLLMNSASPRPRTLLAGFLAVLVGWLNGSGRADLDIAGDDIPHEYLNGETGHQAGVPMQGWNAAMFGAIYFGMHRSDTMP